MDDLLNKIFNENCLEGMKRIPDKSIDMVLCDMPYGITNCKWDSIIDLEKMWSQLKRICNVNSPIVLFSQMPFSATLVASNTTMFKYNWVWDKPQGTGHLNAKKMPLKNHEEICIFGTKNITYNPQFTLGKPYKIKSGRGSDNYSSQQQVITENKGFRYPLTVLKFNKDKEKLHPTQKPIALCEYLIKTYTNENDIVLDFCIGSGTTAIAAINTKRNYIGFENDEKYFNSAINRIKNHLIPATNQEASEASAKVMKKYGKALDNLANR